MPSMENLAENPFREKLRECEKGRKWRLQNRFRSIYLLGRFQTICTWINGQSLKVPFAIVVTFVCAKQCEAYKIKHYNNTHKRNRNITAL